jgi:hypothetical protein
MAEEEKDKAWKLLIDSLNETTTEIYKLRQKEISYLQTILDLEKKTTFLISEMANEKYKNPEPEKEAPK